MQNEPCMRSDLRDPKITCGYATGHDGPCSFGRRKVAASSFAVAGDEQMIEEITQAARSYKSAIEVGFYRGISRAVKKQSAELLLKMKAIREKYGNAAVDAVLKDCSADSDTYFILETPIGIPWCIEEIEKRAASGRNTPIRRPRKHQPSPLDAVEHVSMEL